MVGILHFSIYGGGCSVGTKMYKHYIGVMEDEKEMKAYVDLKKMSLQNCSAVGNMVQRTTAPAGPDGSFYKIIRYNLFHTSHCPVHGVNRGDNWRRLFAVYDVYGRLPKETMPNALVPATLLFGEFQVAIKMDFVTSSTDDDGNKTEADSEDLVDALVYLAEHGLIYTDFHRANIMRSNSDGRLRLIDYDDMKMVAETFSMAEEYGVVLESMASPDDDPFTLWVKSAVQSAISKPITKATP